MTSAFSRRNLLQLAGAAAILRTGIVTAQQRRGGFPGSRGGSAPPIPFPELAKRSNVALISGDDRRKNVYNALMAIDKELQSKLENKKYVVIKPNNVSATNQLASTHLDALRGIIDYVSERFKGPVVIAESSAAETLQAFENFNYNRLVAEYPQQKIELVDLNQEAKYEMLALLDADLQIAPVRLAARLFDPDAFVICSAMLKTHNALIATLSVKNMVLGAPLHQAPGEIPRWNDKRKFHVGLRQMHYNVMVTAQKMQPYWGATLIDGFEGMEGNGPSSGTPVNSRFAIASTDYIAADRVGIEAMGIDPEWMGYLKYCGQIGLGQYDLSKIDILGVSLAEVKKSYRLHSDIERELQWRGPMEELPFNLGWITPSSESCSEYLFG
ncbi:DUF362 domain-containing protein [Planctomycetota bacterium]